MDAAFDVIVIGAGPAGSSAAILLANAGWSVALVEKAAFPRRKVCGECIAASNLPLLDALGVGVDVDRAAGPALRHFAFMRGDRLVGCDLPEARDGRHRWGVALGRETLDTLLLARARSAGVTVLQPCAVQAIDGDVGRWRCLARAVGSFATLMLTAPVLVAAHGSWERLPADRPLRPPVRRPSDLLAFKANFARADMPPGMLSVIAFDGGYGGMVLAENDTLTLACCIRADRLAAIRLERAGTAAGEVVESLLVRECRGVRDALANASRQGAWLAAGPLAPGVRLRATDGFFRIGNAAGEAHPIIGEGISMALQSAWLLCVRLLAERGVGHLRDADWQRRALGLYAGDWRRAFSTRLMVAAAFAQVAMQRDASAALMSVGALWPGLFAAGAAMGGKTRCAVMPAVLAKLAPRLPPSPTPPSESTRARVSRLEPDGPTDRDTFAADAQLRPEPGSTPRPTMSAP